MLELAFSVGIIILAVYSFQRTSKRERSEAENRKLIERLFYDNSGRIPRDIFDRYAIILIDRRISDLKHIYGKEKILSLYDRINSQIKNHLAKFNHVDNQYVYTESESIIDVIIEIISEETYFFRQEMLTKKH